MKIALTLILLGATILLNGCFLSFTSEEMSLKASSGPISTLEKTQSESQTTNN